jgi:hypothetical protein
LFLLFSGQSNSSSTSSSTSAVIDSGYSSSSQQESTFFRGLEVHCEKKYQKDGSRDSSTSDDGKMMMIVDDNNATNNKEPSVSFPSSVPPSSLSAAIGVFSDDSLVAVPKRIDKDHPHHHPEFHGLFHGSTSSSCVSLSLLALTLPSQSTSPLWMEFGFLSAPVSPKEKKME